MPASFLNSIWHSYIESMYYGLMVALPSLVPRPHPRKHCCHLGQVLFICVMKYYYYSTFQCKFCTTFHCVYRWLTSWWDHNHNYSSKSHCYFFQVILSGIVLSCGVVCLVFNIVFRNRKLVKKIVKKIILANYHSIANNVIDQICYFLFIGL